MRRAVHATIFRGDESGWVAECAELHAVTQGETLDEVTANLREIVGLALDGEDLAELGLVARPLIKACLRLPVLV